eukprot:TRINITY_DN2141_c0_g1_i1.p1 TRINITY_DN2141_c0_g1~~TRINITY_DN2141_c0_g1_i1.p1  ORF type:complete len:683 (-),score=166.10 TRINITY_DN2141_c0_g1_i1:44-2092(-)
MDMSASQQHRRTRSGTIDSPPNGIDRSAMEVETISKLRKKAKKERSATVDGAKPSKKDKKHNSSSSKKHLKEGGLGKSKGGSWSEDMMRTSKLDDNSDSSDDDSSHFEGNSAMATTTTTSTTHHQKKEKMKKKKGGRSPSASTRESDGKPAKPRKRDLSLAAMTMDAAIQKRLANEPETPRSLALAKAAAAGHSASDGDLSLRGESHDDIDLMRKQKLESSKAGTSISRTTGRKTQSEYSTSGVGAGLETVMTSPTRSSAGSQLTVPESGSQHLSRWGSLRGLRDGLKRELRLGEEEITHNPLVALNHRAQAESKDRIIQKEREILSESTDLDERTRLRHKCINEIINTERDYIKDLNVIIKLILEPMLKENIITHEESKDIFSNIKSLFGVNDTLYSELWAKAKETDGNDLGQIFSDLSNYLKLYSQYCGNQRIAREAIADALKNNNKFKAFTEKHMQAVEYGGLSIKDYLIKPVQRLCKYPLLLRELLKYTPPDHPDYAKLNIAFDNISTVVLSVNAQKQQEEEMEEVADIVTNRFEGAEKFKVPLMVPGRKFVKEGTIKTASADHTSTTTSYYFLFSDLLVLANEPDPATVEKPRKASSKSEKGNKPLSARAKLRYEVTAMLPFKMCQLTSNVPNDATNEIENLVEVVYGSEKHTFVLASEIDKEQWCRNMRQIPEANH